MSEHDEVMVTSSNGSGHSPPGSGLRVPRNRSRCVSCSDTTYGSVLDDSSLLLDIRPRKFRTPSICEQIQDEVLTGTIMYFCRSKGHGFIRPDRTSLRRLSGPHSPAHHHHHPHHHQQHNNGNNSQSNGNNAAPAPNNNADISDREEDDHFLHISDIDSDYVPRKGDKVSYRLCPIPPKFEKYQAVHAKITSMSPQPHNKWDTPNSSQDSDLLEDEEGGLPPGDV